MIRPAIERLSGLLTTLQADQGLLDSYLEIKNRLIDVVRNNKTIFVIGNGGSAAQAQHFSAELVGRYKKERRALKAIALHCDTSILTAWSNDYSFETVFSRQIEALGTPGDALVALSTSGRSKNILSALETSKKGNLISIGILGSDGGAAKGLCDFHLIAPSKETERIQEIHLLLLHCLAQEIEDSLVI